MKLLKKINNNFALALDNRGETIIVEGKGIGFQKMPCELSNLKLVTRSYYDFDERYIELLTEIPYEVVFVANVIHKHIRERINCTMNPNLPFILADHIAFSIQRWEKNISLKMPMYYDLQQLYPLEFDIAEFGLHVIEDELGIALPKEEIFGIALNIINSQMNMEFSNTEEDFQRWIQVFTEIIENFMSVTIAKDSFNYSRFVSHIRYLYQRTKDGKNIESDNIKMYQSLREGFPTAFHCSMEISNYLMKEENIILDDEEKIYLILHINRLCDRVDCNRKGITPNI
ncbi:PRD domain-containing protein [Amedibacillus sp. YH-ame10]